MKEIKTRNDSYGINISTHPNGHVEGSGRSGLPVRQLRQESIRWRCHFSIGFADKPCNQLTAPWHTPDWMEQTS
jgi:hypothetical protein